MILIEEQLNMVIITKGLSYNDTFRSPTIRQLLYLPQTFWDL